MAERRHQWTTQISAAAAVITLMSTWGSAKQLLWVHQKRQFDELHAVHTRGEVRRRLWGGAAWGGVEWGVQHRDPPGRATTLA